MRIAIGLCIVLISSSISLAAEPHTLWLEAETFGPLHGGNFSFQDQSKTPTSTWSIAGPDVAVAWTQGGESEFLSVAARADEPGEVVISRDAEAPADGAYALWVRFVDHRNRKQSFGVRIRQGDHVQSFRFGDTHVVDELDQMKLIWDAAFGWDHAQAELKKGPVKIELFTTGPTEARRQIDCLCLTTDTTYHPYGREKPDSPTWKLLRAMRDAGMKSAASIRATAEHSPTDIPAAWKLSNKPPVFLWNAGKQWLDQLEKPAHVEWPFAFDSKQEAEFITTFAGKDLAVYGSPLSGPAIHIAEYPKDLADNGGLQNWSGRHADRPLAILLNYGSPNWPDKKNPDKAGPEKNLAALGDRFIGFVCGEAVSNGGYDRKTVDEKVRASKTRADVLEFLRDGYTQGAIKSYTDYLGKPVTAEQAWSKNIPCLSASNETLAHALAHWGVKRIGHENSGNSPTLARRLAFLRGAARQFHAGILDYQSCNLGDSSTIFSREGLTYPATSRYILDNQYDAWSGAGLNWVLKDYLLFHLAGADAFYHEEGNDIFWKPAGNSAGDARPIELSPRGRVTDAIVKLAQSHPRGTQYTPIAFLLDEAHGYSQEMFQPGAFGLDPELNPQVLTFGRHGANIRGWFDVAYFPAPETQNEPATGVRQTYVNGIFGDIFDVIVTAPGHTNIASAYPVIIVAGEVPISEEWGKTLSQYVEQGGTLVICSEQLRGASVAQLNLPVLGEAREASQFEWTASGQVVESNVFRYRPISAPTATTLASTNGQPIASAIDRGKGRLIYLSVPMGLGIDQRPSPLLAKVLEGVASGIMPIRVVGDVEWAVNRLDTGWLVTVLNNNGVNKPQHGVNPTDYRAWREVQIEAPPGLTLAGEWLSGEPIAGSEAPAGQPYKIKIPAGAARLFEFRAK